MNNDEAERYKRMVKSVEIHGEIKKLLKQLDDIGYELVCLNGKNGIRKVEK